jgi:hypothetical protein
MKLVKEDEVTNRRRGRDFLIVVNRDGGGGCDQKKSSVEIRVFDGWVQEYKMAPMRHLAGSGAVSNKGWWLQLQYQYLIGEALICRVIRNNYFKILSSAWISGFGGCGEG